VTALHDRAAGFSVITAHSAPAQPVTITAMGQNKVGRRSRRRLGTVAGDTGGDGGTGIDTTVPHSARIWNYWLGGKDNYAVDRMAGDQTIAVLPEIVDIARASREFLARVVRYLAADAGIRQFLDIGTGLPTANNTHEVAQRVAPSARVVYVDNDPSLSGSVHVGTPLEGSTRDTRHRPGQGQHWKPRRSFAGRGHHGRLGGTRYHPGEGYQAAWLLRIARNAGTRASGDHRGHGARRLVCVAGDGLKPY
jgi:hypothetical protein